MFLEVGFENPTSRYTEYPILWFPQGIFVIITADVSHTSQGITISLTLHDKMALLNGECGGVFPASVVFNGDCGGTISSSVEFDRYDTVDENGQ